MNWKMAFTGPVCIGLLIVAGCGSGHDYMTQELSSSEAANFESSTTFSENITVSSSDSESQQHLIAAQDRSLNVNDTALRNRKIIYNTTMELVVEDYQAFETNLPAVVKAHGGFVASNKTQRTYNDSQSATWVIRVPVMQYDSFLGGVGALGFAESRDENAMDVTEEYVDIEARLKNKKALEERVLGILEDRSGKLSEVLEIERELSRVREEIERMEGRIRFLKDRTSLATVTIRCREEQEYIPAAAPTIGSRVADAWSGSLSTLQRVAAFGLIAIVALTPWLVVFAAAGFAVYRLCNRFRGRKVFLAKRFGETT